MKWTLKFGAAAAVLGMSAVSQAGMLGGLFSHHRASGCCEQDCCEQPCRPLVSRPCEQTYTYQRKCSDLRPPCCDENCCEDPGCSAPCDVGCAPEACTSCSGNRGCGLFKSFCKRLKKNSCFGNHKGGLCNHGESCCEEGCGDECCDTANACEIAKLIYTAQTACYAKDREQAVDDLGDFDCRCHPEIMVTLIYSLNDASEKVREQAADEIGDLLDDGRCCCSPEIVAALTCALGDCDDDVRDQAEEALSICGYDVVEGCCGNEGCGNVGCNNVGGNMTAPATPAQAAPVPNTTTPPAPKKEATPAPAPPEDPEAYFPSRYRKQTSRHTGLSNLFGLAN
jgi:hypothetical protein